MLSALALFGAATLQRPQAQYSAVAAILSGLAWMAAVIAYPTMPVVLLAFLALALLAARGRSERLHLLGYAMICLVFQFCGAWLLLQLYGWTRIWQILEFSSGVMQNSEDLRAKFARSLDLFVSHPAFDMLCLAAVTVGIWLLVAGRDRRRDVWLGLLLLAIVLGSYCTETAVWFHPHDIVVLLALAGLFVMRSFDGAEAEPVIRVIYLASLVGALVTSVTSNNGFYNFPIGGLAAAALAPAMLVPRDAPWKAVAGQCGLLLSTVVLFCISVFASVYGETSNPLTTPAGTHQGRRVRRAVDHDRSGRVHHGSDRGLRQKGRARKNDCRHGTTSSNLSADGGVAHDAVNLGLLAVLRFVAAVGERVDRGVLSRLRAST